jgi:uncharacterized membrane protein
MSGVTPLTPIYLALGALLAAIAFAAGRDASNPRRHSSAVFWGLLALAVALGDWLPAQWLGALVMTLALIAGFGGIGRGVRAEPDVETRRASAARYGARLFGPALAIPVLTIAAVFGLGALRSGGAPVFATQQVTLLGLALACAIALGYALVLLRERPAPAVEAARALIESIGWAAILPLVLATLGALFAASGVGDLVATLVAGAISTESRFACVLTYCLGMALFTMVMGNAFAAFPVMTAGIGLPLLVGQHGAEPASMAAIGMLAGYCGTLMTPMAANFNIVPAALLELDDKYAVIKAQVPTALPLLAANVLLMWAIVFR